MMAMAAMLVLFGGHDLEGWITLAGEWAVLDGAMVCRSAPAAIRSSYESDTYTLEFQYRGAGRGENQLLIHAGLDGSPGTPALRLTRRGALLGARSAEGQNVPEDEWIRVRLEVGPEAVRATSFREDGRELTGATIGGTPAGRGFLRLQATERGLAIRDIRASEPGFVPMFAGDALDGWEIMGQRDDRPPGWSIENGIIYCRRGWLRTLRTYDNFVLRLEYRLPPRGNSGVDARAPMEGRVSQIGLEIQLLDDEGWRADRLKPSQFNGSVYAGIAPEVQVPAPAEQWNAIEILLDGQRVRTVVNGVQLYDALLDDREKDEQLLRNPLATRRTAGFIGLQDHTGQPRFRNVRIRELKASASTQPAGGEAGR